jgi:hypothetical protein
MPPLESPRDSRLESVADLAITICGVVFVAMLYVIYAGNLFNVILMLAAAS